MPATKLNVDLVLKLLPEFNGQDRSELDRFLNICDTINDDLCPEAEEPLLLTIIKSKISGIAYNSIKYKDIQNLEGLKSILKNNFAETRTIAQVQSEIINSKQKFNENVRQFATRIEKLKIELDDACIQSQGIEAAKVIQELNAKSALRAFVEGLHNNIKLIIKACRFPTLIEAIEGAVEEERNFNSKTSFRNNFSRESIKCSFCQKVGHKFENCFFRKNKPQHTFVNKQPANFTQEPNKPTFNKNKSFCNYCKEPGHHISNCYKRKLKEQRNLNQTSSLQETLSGNFNGPSTSTGTLTEARNFQYAAK